LTLSFIGVILLTNDTRTEKIIYMNIYAMLMRRITIEKGQLTLTDNILCFFQKTVTKFGTGAKIDCPKEFLGKIVYIVVVKK